MTMAANFQSETTSSSSSLILSRLVKKRTSLRILCSSLLLAEHMEPSTWLDLGRER